MPTWAIRVQSPHIADGLNNSRADPLTSPSLERGRHPTSNIDGAFELTELHGHSKRQGLAQRAARKAHRPSEKLQRLLAEDEMKFSHSLQFNAVPDWSSNYISYSNLKKLYVQYIRPLTIRIQLMSIATSSIFTLEKQINQAAATHGEDVESSPLLASADGDPDVVYKKALDSELEKICTFYQLKELEINGEANSLLKDEGAYAAEANDIDFSLNRGDGAMSNKSVHGGRQRRGSLLGTFGFGRPRRTSTMSMSIEEDGYEDSDDDADETAALTRSKSSKISRSKTWDTGNENGDDLRSSRELRPPSRRRPSHALEDFNEATSVLYDSGLTIKKRTISIYVSLCELKSFIQLNKQGFSKALKKYDKVLDRNLRQSYIDSFVTPAYPFRKATMEQLEEKIAKIEKAYAEVVTQGNLHDARRELRLHLREHVVWERNTVWREMIGIERKAQAANLGFRRTILGGDRDPSHARLQGDDQGDGYWRELHTRMGRFYVPSWIFSPNVYYLIGIVVVFVILLTVPTMKNAEQQNCLALLAFVSLLWATEVIPLFVTSLLIPFLVVVLRVVRADEKPHRRLDSKAASTYIFAAMWTPVIMLLLGGFAVAAALSKYHIAKMIATFVLSKAGTRPRTVLLTNMFVAMVASMWISNVAAPVLCFSIIQPLLRNLPSDSEFSKALILGIALASNIGGMASPIASPQNIIALQNMKPEPSWASWFFVALPVCILSIFLIWLILLATFQPGRGTTIVPIRPMKDKFTGVQWFISGVTIGTIGLWCVTHQLESTFGHMGVVAIIPLVLFFGTGILTKEDFNNFLWTIIILAAGGLSLGKAVESSGLLHTIAGAITAKVEGMPLYSLLVVFAGLVLVVATFISHTVAGLIILPLVHTVGASMDEPHPNLLVMGSALMCSAAMGLPTSGFPNMSQLIPPLTLVHYRSLTDML